MSKLGITEITDYQLLCLFLFGLLSSCPEIHVAGTHLMLHFHLPGKFVQVKVIYFCALKSSSSACIFPFLSLLLKKDWN